MENRQVVKKIKGTAIPLHGDEIDTDRIIPARYLKCVTFEGIGRYAFFDERFDEEGNGKPHPFNDPRYRGASVLLTNKNFGCGSSREHAPQSLLDFGIKAFIGESFAEIFAGNCTALGLPAVTVSREDILDLMSRVEEDPALEIEIDMKEKKAVTPGKVYAFHLPESTHKAFLLGKWDSTDVLLANKTAIEKKAEALPYIRGFVS